MAVLNACVSAYFPQFVKQNRPMVLTSLSPLLTPESMVDFYETFNELHVYRGLPTFNHLLIIISNLAQM
jgi:hypothetical protein